MACNEDTTLEALRNMAQCSICIDTFNDPRSLPCAHTFCLKCLEEAKLKNKAECALCRKTFNIPAGGLKELPKNTMIKDVIELSRKPKSSGNSETVEGKRMTVENSAKPEEASENIETTEEQLDLPALHCGNCNNCEQCARAQETVNNEEVGRQNRAALDEPMKEGSTTRIVTPEPEDTESLCDVCVLNNSDGNQKVSTAALHCKDCNENQCEKCSAEHLRQRLCKNHKVVSLDDHLKEKLIQNEEVGKNDDAIICDVCLDNNESGTDNVALATLHCIDCTENQCDDCSREHKRQRLCKDHQIVEIDDKIKAKCIKMKEMRRSNEEDVFCDVCAANSDDGQVKITATWHCTDCEENQCDECYKQHKRQKLSKDHKAVALDDQMKDKLIKIKEMDKATKQDIFCDICAENSENGATEITATWHCTDCNETQCDDCNREHKRQKLSKGHQCVTLDDQLRQTLAKTKQKKNSTEAKFFCDICRANNEVGKENIFATLHCTVCKENQCEDCCKEHKRQSLSKHQEIISLDSQLKRTLLNVKEINKKPDLEMICGICAENNELGEAWSPATLHCLECDENQCYNCNTEHKRQSLFRNHKVVPIDDHMKSNIHRRKAEADTLCDMCVGNQTADILKATMYCINCEEKQCEECNRSHLRQKQFREHQVITLDEQKQQKEISRHPRTCNIHTKDKLKFYCVTCQQVTCMKCIDMEHKSHEYKFACTIAEGFLNDIDGYLEKVDSWLQEGDVKQDELQLNSLDTGSLSKVSLKSDRNYTPEVLHSPKGHQLNTKKELRKELDEHLANLSTFKRHCDELKTHKSSVSICLLMNELRNKFEDLRRQQELFSSERLGLSSRIAGCKSSDPVFPYCDFRKQMKQLSEKKLTNMLKDEAYSKIRKMMQIPRIEEDNIKQFWNFAFPYIVQRVKMWNGYVLTAQNIADLVIRRQKKKDVTDSQFVVSSTKKPQKITACEESVYPVSRLDCMTYLINIADCIVAHDVLRIMSKFPMAIPLVVQDIYEDDNYIVTVPVIQNTIIKWESSPGQIAENHLFTSPFRMVAAIRLGTNKIGKSTILNQLMSKPFLFSSKGEAGSRYGRPCTLDGAVEIVWLTQETCSNPTWKTTMSEYYRGNTEEVAILANLHGSVLQHPETLKYLAKFVCSFIVFLMPDFSVEEYDQLKQIIKRNTSIQVLVDPPDIVDEEDHINIIRTESLSNDDTLDTMRCLLKESLGFHTKKASKSIAEMYNFHDSLRYAELLHCKQSAEIVEIARNLGCFKIKQLLHSADIKKHSKWDYGLQRLIKLSLDIISLPTMDAKKYLTHLETNLSQISASESITARAEVSDANRKLRSIVKAPKKPTRSGNYEDKQMEEDLKKAQKELEEAMNKVDDMNLGQEHFFRTLGRMYENSLGVADLGQYTAVRDLPKHFADLLTNGHDIEMLDGDSGNMQLIWIKAICDSVLKKLPNLKVFVISIIGLQSSGKSTLLNALFSCRFAVSVGRCSRGLFMRMIFLDEALRTSHGYDAVILIDTEGLSSPEKMNDPRASQKDRLMATYAIGISNLTIVNILGEGMTEMTEILQIAIVAMARLREGGIKPDILIGSTFTRAQCL